MAIDLRSYLDELLEKRPKDVVVVDKVLDPRYEASAIVESAAAVAFCHNHPSGDATPSREDQELTRRLVQAGTILGIRVLDHVVIGRGRYVSLAERGII